MRLNTVSLLCLAALTALSPSLAFAEAPSAPGNLRAEIYSTTAGEIFWSRSTDSNGVVVGYEVLQDGELITSRDALSYFADNLTDGVISTFSVIALDNDGERSETVSIDVTTGVSGNAAEAGNRPLPPANLFATVYSATAAEVFFDRNTDPSLTYEVSLDGVAVATIDGTSFFFGELTDGQSNNVDVVAINANGTRSSTASVQFNTTGDTSDGGDNPAVDSAIDAPPNLRLEVYSATAGELFWDRSSQTDLIDTTEVRRNGVVVSTTDGTSFFDDTRVPGVAYLYEVSFISVDGGQSNASVVDETGGIADSDGDGNDSPNIGDIVVNGNVITVPDDGDIYQVQDSTSFAPFCEGLINCEVVPGTYNVINLSNGDRLEGIAVNGPGSVPPDSLLERLEVAFDVVNADYVRPPAQASIRMDLLYSLGYGNPEFTVTSLEFGRLFGEAIYSLDCQNGGTASASIRRTLTPNEGTFSFGVCTIGSLTIDGPIGLREGISQPDIFNLYFFSPPAQFSPSFSITDSNTGDISTYSGLTVRFDNDSDYSISTFPTVSENDELNVIDNATSLFSVRRIDLQSSNIEQALPDGSGGFTLDAEIILRDSAEVLAINTTSPLERNLSSGSRDTGSLAVTGNGFSLSILLNNGDTDTFDAILEENGATVSYSLSWANFTELKPFDPSGFDIGF